MSAGQIIPSVTSVQIHFFQWMRYSSDWLRFNNSVINTQERTEFRSCSLSLWNSNRENAVRTIWNTKMRSPLFRNLPLHICINCITQTKDITQNKYSKVPIQHIQLPCREEESQKHEAHLNRKYWKRNKLKLDLDHRGKDHLNLCNGCVHAVCPRTTGQKLGWTKSIQRDPMPDNL